MTRSAFSFSFFYGGCNILGGCDILLQNLNKKAKKIYYSEINLCKSFFSNKSGNLSDRITLIEHGKTISDNFQISNIFNLNFTNVASSPINSEMSYRPSPCNVHVSAESAIIRSQYYKH